MSVDQLADMRKEAFADSKLEKLDENTYKLTPPKRWHWVYVVFTPIGVVIGGDQGFGDLPGQQAVSLKDFGKFGFLGESHDEYIGEKFFGKKPTSKAKLERWYNDVRWLAALRHEFLRLYEGAEKAGVTRTA